MIEFDRGRARSIPGLPRFGMLGLSSTIPCPIFHLSAQGLIPSGIEEDWADWVVLCLSGFDRAHGRLAPSNV